MSAERTSITTWFFAQRAKRDAVVRDFLRHSYAGTTTTERSGRLQPQAACTSDEVADQRAQGSQGVGATPGDSGREAEQPPVYSIPAFSQNRSRSDSSRGWLKALARTFKMSSAPESPLARTLAAAQSPPYPSRRRRLGGRVAILSALTALTCLFAVAPASAAEPPAPKWRLTVTPNTDYFLPGHFGSYLVEAENVGDAPTSASEPITVEDIPPAQTTAETATQSTFTHPALLPGAKFAAINVLVKVSPGFQGTLQDVAKISGGGAPEAETSATNAASENPPFGLLRFDAALTDSSKVNPYTQAGGHPYQFVTEFNFETYSSADPTHWGVSGFSSVRDPRAITADLPPGLLANPQAVPHCSLADYFSQRCSRSRDVVGDAGISLEGKGPSFLTIEPIYNLQPQGSYPGELGITFANGPFVVVTAGLRSGDDYGVTATNVAPQENLTRVRLTLWGVPADPAHNAMRGKSCLASGALGGAGIDMISDQEFETHCELSAEVPAGGSAEVQATPFLTMPTECSGNPLTIVGRYDTWQVPGEFAKGSVQFPAVDGCNALSFEPKIQARTTTNLADAPSGLEFNLHIPQNEAFEGDATPELKEADVKLPPGLVVNPSSGDGLQGCTEDQVGLHREDPAACPDASKLGLVTVHTPLLAEPLFGALYLATPHQNPSGSLLAGYIVLEGQGIKVKLAGPFETDETTGQITARFDQNPQLPFEDLEIKTFEGARGALRTPPTCGTYETTSVLTPYSFPESGPAAEPTAEFETTAGPGGEGSPCPNAPAEEPNHPVFHAGTESPQAGIYSPFSLKLVRQDGEQEIKQIETTLPPGLVGKLAGIAECPDAALAAAAGHSGAAEQASPSCPASSEVGTVDVASGAGPTPLNVPGHAYLAGPYKSAPLSLAIITPAVAGPFDLGTVVVRTALNVDPFTAQIHAVSDEIPHILEGIPLDVRSVTLKMARPNFTLNPTNCEPLAFSGAATSVFGQSAPLAQRFQVGGCNALKFKPKLSISLKGGTRRATFPALKAVVTYPKQGAYANIASAQVTLPASANLEQGHINKTCLRPQLASHTCPASSIYGHARAVSPLLDHPLEGPVYLATGFGYQLPALVADLNGQIEVLLAGKVDTGREDGIRNTFEVVPDAPVSKFTLSMFGGKKGLIVNKENICGPRATTKALAKFTAQNGAAIEVEPTVHNSCKKKGRKHSHGKGPSHRVGTSHR
jgi:hypothetical protein